MSYFEEQEEAWEDNNFKGSPTDYNPDEYWLDKIGNCKHKNIKVEMVEDDKTGKIKKEKICKDCQVIL